MLTPIPAIAKTCDAGFAPVIEGPRPLAKRGTGTARYILFRVYDAALYTAETNDIDPPASSTPLCLEICYHRSLSADVIIEAAEKVLRRQNDSATLAAMAPQLDQLHRAYRPVDRGDRYRLCRDADARLTLALNGELLTTVAGNEISQRYPDIWLGEKPLSEPLRRDLLGAESEAPPIQQKRRNHLDSAFSPTGE